MSNEESEEGNGENEQDEQEKKIQYEGNEEMRKEGGKIKEKKHQIR